jgi:hypoxanthine-DNA glycosylase
MDLSTGFPPIARADARILILGSLPGQRSLQEARYYAHRQNTFWRIMAELTGASGDYEHRCQALLEHGIALWDVLRASVRPGSLDADIRLKTAQANDFKELFETHASIVNVYFNGQKAAQLYRRLVTAGKPDTTRKYRTLPSTSPAHAAMSYQDKLAQWRAALASAI